MKFTLSWLKTWLETDVTLDEITTTLSAIGLEVEGVENRAAALQPFVIAEVIEALPHPNADRLRACRVNAGDGEISVVCGAPNARTGMRAVFAPAGAFVPGSGITLKVGEIRGVKSEGMLVSFQELGLSDQHDGIIELPEDAPIGSVYAKWAGLDDPIIEIAVTPNRGDALSVRGVARDLAAAGLGSLRGFTPETIKSEGASSIAWVNDYTEACPWVLGRVVRNVKNGPSPPWLQKRLESVGLRPVNVLADITNFFTIDIGRPLHVFDANKITGGVLTLRRGNGETFEGLNGKPITVSSDDCVIADATGVQSLAGIVGGALSGCDEATSDVFIECALFDRVRIALTGQAQRIISDARQRFERGIDSEVMPAALDAATAMVISLCGGTPSEVSEAGIQPVWSRKAALRFERLKSFGGAEINADEAVASLERLGFGVIERSAVDVRVSVPSWRNDIAQPQALDQADVPNASTAAEGAALIEPEVDLIEEVLRLRGLDAIIPISLPLLPGLQLPALSAKQTRNTLARRVLAARGLLECVTFSFVDHQIVELFGAAHSTLRLANPIAADLDQMRPSPLITLALAAARNLARGLGDLGLFEIGPGYNADLSQNLIAAGIRAGETALSAISPARAYDVFDAKGDAIAILSQLGVPMEAVTTIAEAPAYYHPGQSGILSQGPNNKLAVFGTLHPSLCAKLDLPAGSVAFEIYLDAINEPKVRRKATPVLPSFQPLRRDFAFLVNDNVPVERLLRAAKSAERSIIANVALFDIYKGKGVPDGQISVAIAVTLQPQERSFSEAEIDAVCIKIVAAVAKATGGALRG